MGFARKRVGRSGDVTWSALYRDARGKVRSAGTYRSEKAANKAWQRAEALLAPVVIGPLTRLNTVFGFDPAHRRRGRSYN